METSAKDKFIIAAGQYEREKEYWLRKLAGHLTFSAFPYDRAGNNSGKSFTTFAFDLNEENFSRLLKITQNSDIRIHILLTALVLILLGKYTGNRDLILGVPIYRQERDGEFINTVLTLRANLDSDPSFKKILFQTREDLREAAENANYPIHALLHHLHLPFEDDVFPLFDVVVLLENIHKVEYIEHLSNNVVFIFRRLENGLAGKIRYNALRYHPATMERVSRHFLNILEVAFSNPEIRMADIALLSNHEKELILNQWNHAGRFDWNGQTVHQLFAEQAGRTPHRIALEFEEEQMTYGELNTRANRLAHYLLGLGVGPDVPVGLCLERSLEMVIGILGILKAGGAYVPLDPSYPPERLTFMIEDSQVRILLTQSSLASRFTVPGSGFNGSKQDSSAFSLQSSAFDSSSPFTILCLDRDQDILFAQPIHDPRVAVLAANLAYIIYTSGSTGLPKGNFILHHNISRVVKNTNYIDISDQDHILQLSNYAFDGSTFDFFGALLNGAMLVLIKKEAVLDIADLTEILWDRQITVFFITTALFNALLDIHIHCFRNIRKVLFGGERVSYPHLKKAFHYLGPDRIMHVYGPTESTVFATYYPIRSLDDDLGTVPIGKPITGTQVYILDGNGQVVPIGMPGELYIGGAGLARGYLNRPDLTAENFIPDPFSPEPGARLYKTGDLTRWLADGNIEYLGRSDFQVKLRGFRVEPGEIEAVLVQHSHIREAVVLVREDEPGSKRLAAYVVPVEKDNPPDMADLRAYLRTRLPDYMIPAVFVLLDAMPLTPNAKIDRKALPAPGQSAKADQNMGPQTSEEEILCGLWREVLGREQVSIHDNFFESGGHSLNAVLFLSGINKKFNSNLCMNDMYLHPTIDGLAKLLNKKEDRKPGDDAVDQVIALKQIIPGRPNLFFIHNAGGGIDQFAILANRLTNQFNYWGITMKKERKYHPRKIPLPKLSALYIKIISAIQPRGPYFLAGWCIGGSVAFEMARQLEQMNHQIGLLFLFSSPPPRLKMESKNRAFEIRSELELIRTFLRSDALSKDLAGLKSLPALWKTMVDYCEKNVSKTFLWNALKNDFSEEMWQALTPPYENMDKREIIYYLNTMRSFYLSRELYIPPSKISADVHFFKTTGSDLMNEKVWNEYCRKPITVHPCRGNHFTMFQPAQNFELVDRLNALLEKYRLHHTGSIEHARAA